MSEEALRDNLRGYINIGGKVQIPWRWPHEFEAYFGYYSKVL